MKREKTESEQDEHRQQEGFETRKLEKIAKLLSAILGHFVQMPSGWTV